MFREFRRSIPQIRQAFDYFDLRDLNDPQYVKEILPVLNKVEQLWEHFDQIEKNALSETSDATHEIFRNQDLTRDEFLEKTAGIYDSAKAEKTSFEQELDELCEQISSGIHNIGQKSTENGSPRISIVVPAHNEQRCILQLLLSLSKQVCSYPIEIIIVDNNSDPGDRTAELASKCGVKVLSYKLEQDNPDKKSSQIALARNRGVRTATGDIIVSTDADVVVGQHWVESLINPLIKDQSVSATTSADINYYHRYSHPDLLYTYNILFNHLRKRWIRSLNKGDVSSKFSGTSGNCTAFRKSDFEDIGGFAQNQTVGEDSSLGRNLSKKGKVVSVSEKDSRTWVSPRRLLAAYQELKNEARDSGYASFLRKQIQMVLSGVESYGTNLFYYESHVQSGQQSLKNPR